MKKFFCVVFASAVLASGCIAHMDKPDKFNIYIVPPVSNDYILPDTASFNGKLSDQMKVIMARGEYEPCSFVVKALADVKGFEVVTQDLKQENGKGVISAAAVDVRTVKCWYVAGKKNTVLMGKCFYVPELLLKDDSLVKTDMVSKENFLKLRFSEADGKESEKYVCISDPKGDGRGTVKGESLCLLNSEFPVKDSSTLLPVDIPANTNKQFWITIKAPDDCPSGIYAGEIVLKSEGKVVKNLSLSIKVLPFKLPQPGIVSSIYYKGALNPGGTGTISAGNYFESKSDLQYKKEMEDLVAHGVDSPPLFVEWSRNRFDEKALKRSLEIRKEAGIDNKTLYVWGRNTGASVNDAELEKLKVNTEAFVAYCRKNHDVDKFYFYGIDEAKGEKLTSQRKAWEIIHKAGGGIYVAGYKGTGKNDGNFDLMGDIQDIQVNAGVALKAEADKWHSKGKKIFCYANPQAGVEEPETYRRNYGLFLWQNDYDGAMTHAYQASYGNIWNDFDSRVTFPHCCGCRDEVMAYPTVDGVVDTIGWEGYREGIDDLRYLALLQERIEHAEKSTNPRAARAAAEARSFLAALKKEDLRKKDMALLRLEMIALILKLQDGK